MKRWAGLWFVTIAAFASCSGPLYKPGTVAATPVSVSGSVEGSEGYLTVDGSVKLYYFREGTGAPVLMIHGGPGYPFRAGWKALAPLRGERSFVYYHQRGSGKSTRPVDAFESGNYYLNMLALEEALGIPAQLRDIEAFRAALGVEKITLVGHSFGGFFAALYAAEFPGRVDSLILVAPAEVVRMPMKHSAGLYGSVREKLPENMRKEFDGYLKRFLDYGKIFSKSERELQDLNFEFIRYYAAACGGPGIPENDMFEADEIAGWAQHAAYFSMGREHDFTGLLKRIAAPTLIITGSGDLASEREIMDTYGTITGVRHVTLDAGHFSFDENADAFTAAVKEFLAGTAHTR